MTKTLDVSRGVHQGMGAFDTRTSTFVESQNAVLTEEGGWKANLLKRLPTVAE